MSTKIRISIAKLLAGSAIALATASASAISVTDLGTLNPKAGIIKSASVPQYAWDGWNGLTANLGWAHNSQWFLFSLPRKMTVQILVSSSEQGMHPAFSIWKTTGNFVGTDHNSHKYDQISFGDSSQFLQPQGEGGNGTVSFLGYSNAGTYFTNGDGKNVKFGTPGMSAKSEDRSKAALARTLGAGQYLLVVGGSCNDNTCGEPAPKAFSLEIDKLPVIHLH